MISAICMLFGVIVLGVGLIGSLVIFMDRFKYPEFGFLVLGVFICILGLILKVLGV